MSRDFVGSCQNLISEKITDRKNAAKSLREFLNEESVCKQLDSGGCDAIQVTWERLFTSVKSYIFKELEHMSKLEKGGKQVSGTTIGTRNQMKKDIAETMRTFLKAALNRGHKALKIKEILKHVMHIIKRPSVFIFLVKDYSSMLLHDILPCHQYTTDISHTQWTEMLDVYCDSFAAPGTLSQDHIAHVINRLIIQSSLQFDVDIHKLYGFFKMNLKRVIHNIDNRGSVVEPLLAAFNKYCSVAAPNARGRLCRLGEDDLILSLVHIWKRSSLSLKTQIIEFLWTQLKLHHPNASTNESAGSWAYDDDKWNDCIDNMYQLILKELESTSKRLKLTSTGEGFMSPLFIDLAVSIMYQVFHRDENAARFQEPLSKRRRLSPKWSTLTEQLIRCSRPALLTWLQVISHMLMKWPGEFPMSEIHSLLSELHKLLKDESVTECTHWLLVCMKTVASSSHVGCQGSDLKDIWKRIWDTCLRLKICQEDVFELLSIIAKYYSIEVDQEPWKLIASSQPTRSSVSFLLVLLAHHKLPESFQPLFSSPYDNIITRQFPFRSFLLHYLLPNPAHTQSILSGGIDTFPRVTNRPSVCELVLVLTALIQQSTTSFECHDSTEYQWVTPEYQYHLESLYQFWSDIETLYLRSSLHSHPFDIKKSIPSTGNKQMNTVVLNVLCQFLFQLLEERSNRLMQLKADRVDVLADKIESLVYHFCVVVNVVSKLQGRYLELDELCALPVVCELSNLLQCVSSELKSRFWNENNTSQHYKVLKTIINLLSTLVQQSRVDQVVLKLFCQHFTEGILNTIHQLALHKYELISFSESVASTAFDDCDMMEATPTVDNSHSPSSTSSMFSVFSHIPCIDMIDSSSLSERSTLQKEACKFVIQWYLTRIDSRWSVGNGTESWSIIKELLTNEKADLNSHKTLHVIFYVCTTLVNEYTGEFNSDVSTTILNTIRKILSSNKRNQSVYEHSLTLLSIATPHINHSKDHIELYLSILSGFCTLHSDSALIAPVRCCLVETLSKARSHLPMEITLNTKETPDVTVDEFLLSVLCDTHHTVRMRMVSIVCGLYSNEDGVTLPSHQHKQIFNDICTQLETANLLNGNLDPVSSEDESVNRIASFLSTLVGVACTSVSCEHQVMSRLVSYAGNKHIAEALVKKAIDNIVEYLGFPLPSRFLEGVVGYLMVSWLKEGDIHGFPYAVFGESSLQAFLRKYSHSIVPHIMWSCDHHVLESIATICDQPLTHILKECLPICMVFIITIFSEETNNGEDSPKKLLATSCYDYLVSTLTSAVVDETMKHSLNEFIVELLLRLHVEHDSDSVLAKHTSIADPCPMMPYYSSAVVQRTLSYLPTCYFTPQLTFVATMTKKKDMIQSILLSLNLKLYSTHRLHQRKCILLSYSLFVRLVCQELETGLGGSLAYVVMEIVHSMLRILDHHTPSELTVLFPVVCDTLYCLLEASCKVCPQVVTAHYCILFSKLSPLIRKESDEGSQARKLFKLLLEHGDRGSLVDHVTTLDPLPDTQVFNDVNRMLNSLKLLDGLSLSQELDRFSAVSETLLTSEGLERIHDVLTHRRSIVHQILTKNDPYVKSPVVDFIQALTLLARKAISSDDDMLSVARISRCFGDIGYMEIPCIALPQRGDVGQKSVYKVFSVLSGFLTDTNITVVKETCSCLKALLSTQIGLSLLKKFNDNTPLDSTILDPFKQKKKSGVINIKHSLSPTSIPWIPDSHSSHTQWLTQLVISLLGSGWMSNEALVLLGPVCAVKPELCQWTFPLIVHDILAGGRDDYREKLSTEVLCLLSAFNCSLPSSISNSSIVTLLDMLMYLRTQSRSGSKNSAWDSNFWLELDFLEVSKAAISCSSYFTALLYLEIWYNHQLNNIYDGAAFDEEEIDPLDGNPSVKNLLLTVYDNIREPDSLFGAIILYSPQQELRQRLYEHQGHWDRALSVYNWQSMLQSETKHSHLVEIFKNLGLPQVLEMYVKGVESTNTLHTNELKELQYEAAWKYMTTAGWPDSSNSNVTVTSDSHSVGFHSHVNNCLFAVKQNEQRLFEDCLNSSRHSLLEELCSSSNQSVCRLHPYLAKLQCLQELEEFGVTVFTKQNTEDLFSKWRNRLSQMGTEFQHVDLVLSMRAACVYSIIARDQSPLISSILQSYRSELYRILETSAKLAREAGKYQIAEASFFTLKNMIDNVSGTSDMDLIYRGQLQEAELCWARKESSLALMLMDKLLTTMGTNDTSSSSVYPWALCLYGSWLAETKSQNPVVILEEYLQKAVSLMDLQSHDHLIQGHLTLARFADSQYKSLTRQMESKNHEAKKQLVQNSKKDLKNIRIKSNTDVNLQRQYRQLKAHNNEDELIIAQQELDQRHFLEIALTNYIMCLKAGNEHDFRIFRVCSLWFNNNNEELNTLMQDEISGIPSVKFLPLMYQLAARMSYSTKALFQTVLQEILFKICTDHPYHSLYVILALSNASLDNEFPQNGYVTGTRGQPPAGKKMRRSSVTPTSGNVRSVDEDKVKAAKDLIGRLQSTHSVLIRNMSQLCEAYVDLAYHDVSAFRNEKKPIKLPSSSPILKTHLKSVAIPTMDLAVDPTCQYTEVVTLERFDGCISLCGGVNLPKVISCLGSDGRRRRQLVKGRDDLRQDAVMQQVFGLVNRLLLKEPATAKRKLSVRTYKVVPLSQCSGIVEWCEGTIPIGQYLIGTNENPFEGAHSRYRPRDWNNKDCRKKFGACNTQNKEQKLKLYEKICSHFKPVFHHFFMETFLSPSLWFERRLAYTRNVAASSIVCYIVGLGDRHIQNILIDKETAELIHIDLGVAFEQGKTLPTPELIPFRLTRDLVDGMGVTGVDGVFKRCCEETMAVMRSSNEELKTIVEVLLYDPLYLWSISPHKVQTLQGNAKPMSMTSDDSGNSELNTNANRMAERVLIRLQEKLEGIEDGTLLNIPGQVNHLIQEATDPLNLSLLFHGWQPWV